MESNIIAEGFSRSIEMYGLIYKNMIAEGDGGCYEKILETDPYSAHNLVMNKIECRNHLLRNYSRKIEEIAKYSRVALLFYERKFSDIKDIMQCISNFDGGPKRFHHAAVAVGHRIYSFGGLRYAARECNSMNVLVLNTTTFRWTQHPVSELPHSERNETLPYKRMSHTAVVYGQKIYIWGGMIILHGLEYRDFRGENASNPEDELICFDTTSSRWTIPETTGNVPSARYGHSACIWRQYMYIYGGYERTSRINAEHIYALDLEKMEWKIIRTQSAPKPTWHTTVCLGDHMYMFGGRLTSPHTNEEFHSNELWYLDLLTNIWHRPVLQCRVPGERISHSAFVYEEKMYICGGFNPTGGETYNDIYHFDPKTMKWSEVLCEGVEHCNNVGQISVMVNDRLFLFGGIKSSELPTVFSLRTRKSIGHSRTYVLDFKPTLKTLCMLAVNKHKLDNSALPLALRNAMADMFHPKQTIVSLPDNPIG